MHKLLWIVSVVVALTACQQPIVKDEDSRLYRLGMGSQVILNKTLVIPKRRTRVFIQDGKVSTFWNIDQYEPFCNFEVRTKSDGSARIEPDTFEVTALFEDEEQVVELGPGKQLHPLYADSGGKRSCGFR